MTGSPTTRGRPRKGRVVGFTLIEILVVVAIVGIVVVVAAVNLIPSDAQVARRESGLVALAVEHARDAAWFGGRPTSITFEDGRVREWRLKGDAWQADTERDRRLAPGARVTAIFVDGQPLKPDARLVFLADGLGVPFRIALEVRGLPWAIEGDAAGTVSALEGG